jgi:hypothetical protein
LSVVFRTADAPIDRIRAALVLSSVPSGRIVAIGASEGDRAGGCVIGFIGEFRRDRRRDFYGVGAEMSVHSTR